MLPSENPYQSPSEPLEPKVSQREEIWGRTLTQWPWILGACLIIQALCHFTFSMESILGGFFRSHDSSREIEGALQIRLISWMIPVLSAAFLWRLGMVLIKRQASAFLWVKRFHAYAVTWIVSAIMAGCFMYYSVIRFNVHDFGLQEVAARVEADPNFKPDSSQELGYQNWKRLQDVKANALKSEILDFGMVIAKLSLVFWWFGRGSILKEMAAWNTPNRFTQYPVVEATNWSPEISQEDEDPADD